MNYNIPEHFRNDIRNIFSFTPQPMCITRLDDGTFIDVNKSYTNYSGFKPKDVIGKKTLEIGRITANERAKVLNNVRIKGYSENVGKEIRNANDELQYIIFNTYLIKSGNDGLLLTTINDISSLWLGEESQNDILFKTLAAIQGIGIILIKDYKGELSVFFENDEARRILRGKSIKELFYILVERETILLSNESGYYNIRLVSTHNNLFIKTILMERLSSEKFITETVGQYELSARQREIALLMATGYSNKEIAEKFCISEHTVKDHVKEIFQKIGVHRRGQLFSKIFNL